MISLDKMIYAIYLLQVGFHPVAPVGRLVKNWEGDSCVKKGNNTKTQNTQNKTKNTKQKTNVEILLRHISRIIIK